MEAEEANVNKREGGSRMGRRVLAKAIGPVCDIKSEALLAG